MGPDEALALFAQELVADTIALAAGSNVPVVPPAAEPGMPPRPAPPRTGAGAVHPGLGHHLVTQLPHDTISGHAYRHVPRPYEVPVMDAKTAKLLQVQDELGVHRDAMDRVREYRQAAAELDRHSADLQKHGQVLPGTWKPMTPDEHASHSRFTEDAISRALDAGQATTATHTYDGHGQVWTPERAALHKDIVDELMEKAERVPSGRRMTLIGGIPGRAKHSVAKQAAPEKEHLHISVPAIKEAMADREMIPPVSGLSPMEASPLVHGEAEHVADMATREALRRGKNVAVHTSMADPEVVQQHVQRARAAGHTVHGVFVHTPAEQAASAAVAAHRSGHEKFRQQQSNGARYLAPALVRSAETSPGQSVNSEGFEQAKPHLGSWESWDASNGLKKTGSSGQPKDNGIPTPEELLGVR